MTNHLSDVLRDATRSRTLSNSEPPGVQSLRVKSHEAAGRLAADATIQRSPVVTRAGLRRVLGPISESTLSVLINQLVRAGTLVRVRPGLFINTTRPFPARGMSLLLTALRPNSLCYLSFESALSYWGSIDQVPTIWTFATTGSSGTFPTPWSAVEMRHTSRRRAEILKHTGLLDEDGMLIASPQMAAEDCVRHRRTTSALIQPEDHALAMEDWRSLWGGGTHRDTPRG